eukprot:7382896-Prymnesium_polylepis.2
MNRERQNENHGHCDQGHDDCVPAHIWQFLVERRLDGPVIAVEGHTPRCVGASGGRVRSGRRGVHRVCEFSKPLQVVQALRRVGAYLVEDCDRAKKGAGNLQTGDAPQLAASVHATIELGRNRV